MSTIRGCCCCISSAEQLLFEKIILALAIWDIISREDESVKDCLITSDTIITYSVSKACRESFWNLRTTTDMNTFDKLMCNFKVKGQDHKARIFFLKTPPLQEVCCWSEANYFCLSVTWEAWV